MKITAALLATTAAVVQAANFQPLIVGGDVVPAGQKTYQVGLRRNPIGNIFCGGSLITPTHVLTAGHCAGIGKYVTVGSHFSSGNIDGEIIVVKNETRHPRFVDDDSFSYDYTILELEWPSRATPIKLASVDPEPAFVGQMATALGYGTTSEGGKLSKELLRVNVPVVSFEQCLAANLTGTNLTETMFCAGGEENKDACQGDSGGPIILEYGEQDVLIGASSWGNGCGRAGKPGVYSKVSIVKSWILEHAPNVTFV